MLASFYCFQYFKDTNWKLFTTESHGLLFYFALFSIFQRYKLKAIHNMADWISAWRSTVFNISKIQIESYSQHHLLHALPYGNCFQYFKDTNWKLFTTGQGREDQGVQLFSIFQRYKLKAIHNYILLGWNDLETVFNISKIQIESYSQPSMVDRTGLTDCFQYFKDTNWKLFTTQQLSLILIV